MGIGKYGKGHLSCYVVTQYDYQVCNLLDMDVTSRVVHFQCTIFLLPENGFTKRLAVPLLQWGLLENKIIEKIVPTVLYSGDPHLSGKLTNYRKP